MGIKRTLKGIKFEKPKPKHFLVFGFILSSLVVSLLVGLVSNDSKKEKISNDIATIVKNDTETSTYLGVHIKKTADNAVFSSQDNETEFRKMYGLFRQERATFAVGFNLDKEHTITVDAFENDENQSIIHVGQSTSGPYENGYKHNPYPIIFVLPLIRDESKTKNCVSISESKAKKMLSNIFPDKNPEEFTVADYSQFVIGQEIKISVDGFEDKYTIQNVYYEQDYYYDCLKETVGDFIVFSEYFYPVTNGKQLNQQRMYFFTSYAYQNKYFIDYINSSYNTTDYSISIATHNVVKGEINQESILQFRNFIKNDSSTVWETILIIVAIAFAFASVVFSVEYDINRNFFSLIICLLLAFVPYLVFKLIFVISGNISFFSGIGTKVNGILAIIYIVFLIIYTFKERKRNESISV